MTQINVLRVFTDMSGNYGNPVGIVVDTARKIHEVERQRISSISGYSEMVFVNDLEFNSISIFTPQRQIAFAGHAVVGAAAFLAAHTKINPTSILCQDKRVECWKEGDLFWVKAALSTAPSWKHEQLTSVDAIENLAIPFSDEHGHAQLWAWMNEKEGVIRARTFAPDWGIPEDEANGSGSMMLAAALGRDLTIHHGKGSIIYARPSSSGYAEVGGRVVFD